MLILSQVFIFYSLFIFGCLKYFRFSLATGKQSRCSCLNTRQVLDDRQIGNVNNASVKRALRMGITCRPHAKCAGMRNTSALKVTVLPLPAITIDRIKRDRNSQPTALHSLHVFSHLTPDFTYRFTNKLQDPGLKHPNIKQSTCM